MPDTTASYAKFQDRSNWETVGPWTGWGLSLGIAKATEGLTFRDPTFDGNWHNLREIPHQGAYHFFHPALSARDQAAFFLDVVRSQGLRDGDILAGDIEILTGRDGSLQMSPHAAKRSALVTTTAGNRVVLREGQDAGLRVLANLSAAEVNEGAWEFLVRLHEDTRGRNPVWCYTNLSVGAQIPKCTGFPLWLAWPSSTLPESVAPWPRRLLVGWQWSWTGGYENGDQDVFLGTPEELTRWISEHDGPHPPAETTPVPPPVNGDDTVPSGNLYEKVGRPETHNWPEGSQATVVLSSDWEPVQGKGPEVEIKALRMGKGFDAAVRVEVLKEGSTVHEFPNSADVNGVSLTRVDAGAANVAWHTNAVSG